AAIGRPPAPELSDAEHNPNHGEEAAENRSPDHDLAPQRDIAAQRGEIEPVRDGAEPVPEALRRRGPEHDLAGGPGNIDAGARRVVEVEAVERPVADIAADGPLIDVDALMGDDRGTPDDARRGRSRDALGDVRVDADHAPTGKVDERIELSRAAEPQRGPAGMGLDLRAQDCLIVGNEALAEAAAFLPGNRRLDAQALRFLELRIPDIHHDDAGDEPNRHEQPDRDSEIAVQDDERAPDAVPHVRGCRPGQAPLCYVNWRSRQDLNLRPPV